MSKVKRLFSVGDKVKILSVDSTHDYEGRLGIVVALNDMDALFPYRVKIKNGRYPREFTAGIILISAAFLYFAWEVKDSVRDYYNSTKRKGY